MKKDPLIGKRLANFLVDKPLGRGGMAQVYYGIDTSLERPVAIKVIDSRYQADPEYARRFVDEAKLIARWRHENIIQVYYAGNEEDIYFYAMEFIDGLSLEAILERYLEQGTLMPYEEVLRIGRAVGAALDYAHRQGVVHRDVKPSNIMVGKDDRVVLMDFGLALDMGQGSMGQVFGTPHYISPEQARKSSDATSLSDIYSFGVVLYEMLVGSIPFDDPSATSVAVQHMTQEPPPPTLINPALGDAVEKVLLKALAKNPEERYKGATAMMDALAAAISKIKKAPHEPGVILAPAATSGQQRKLSALSISELLTQDLDDDGPSTIFNPKEIKQMVAQLQTQEVAIPAQLTEVSKKGQTREMSGVQPTPAASPANTSNNRTGLLVALGAALIVVAVVMLAVVAMNMGGNNGANADMIGTQTQIANLAATNQSLIDSAATETANAQSVPVTEETSAPAATVSDDLGATATAIVLTNAIVNAENTTVAQTNAAVFAQQTSAADSAQTQNADNALATSNANLELTLTAQITPAAQATVPAFPDGIPVEITFNKAGFYLRNSSNAANIRLSNLSFRALDSSGNPIGMGFSGTDWTRFYSNVDRNGYCVAIELLDQSSWTRPNNCVDYNSQLTFPTTDQRIFWTSGNGASQFAVYWSGTEAGRCAISDNGFCTILLGR